MYGEDTIHSSLALSFCFDAMFLPSRPQANEIHTLKNIHDLRVLITTMRFFASMFDVPIQTQKILPHSSLTIISSGLWPHNFVWFCIVAIDYLAIIYLFW